MSTAARSLRWRLAALAMALPLAASLLALPLGSPAVGASGAPAVRFPGCAKVPHAGGEWRTFGHDFSNTRNQSAEKTIGIAEAPTLQPAFTFSADAAGGGGDFSGTPIITDGCLYVGSNDGWVFAANADTGKKVWARQIPDGGGINSTLGVSKGRVYAAVAQPGRSRVVALDQGTGKILWTRQVDSQPGSDVYGSPVIFDDILIIGVSGGSAELGDESDRYAFQGSFLLIETGLGRAKPPGTILRKTYTIRPPDADPDKPKNSFAGGAVWGTPAFDPRAKVAYVGTGNPFRPQAEHKHTNAVIKIDMDRRSPRFGKIIASHKGDIDEYVPGFSDLPCYDIEGNPAPYYPQGVGECGDLDMDFGSSPNLWKGPGGRLLVGTGQKSGVYHVFDAKTMKPEWKSIVGPPSAVGGIVGSTATDGGAVYGPITIGGYLWSVQKAGGTPRWVSPVGDGAHWGNPVSYANGVVYSSDLRGNLNAYEARTGAPLLSFPMLAGARYPTPTWGGVAIARNTVYAAVGTLGLPAGFIVAFRAGGGGGGGGGGGPELPPTPSIDGPGQVVSGPQAQFYGYVTPVVVTSRGGKITYSNVDIVRHDVIQDPRTDGVSGPGTKPWCSRFPAGKCPVFWTPLIGVGQSTPVKGLENTKPGRTYSFYCSLHPGMKGSLIVQ